MLGQSSSSDIVLQGNLNPDAEEYYQEGLECVVAQIEEVDRVLKYMQIVDDVHEERAQVTAHLHPERSLYGQSAICPRRELIEERHADVLAQVAQIDLTECTVVESHPPFARSELRDACIAETLPITPVTADVMLHCLFECEESQTRATVAVGDVVRFVDGKRTHILDFIGRGRSSRYCHDEYVRIMQVGCGADFEGWLEVRAVSWEKPNRSSDFECRGWMKIVEDGKQILATLERRDCDD